MKLLSVCACVYIVNWNLPSIRILLKLPIKNTHVKVSYSRKLSPSLQHSLHVRFNSDLSSLKQPAGPAAVL